MKIVMDTAQRPSREPMLRTRPEGAFGQLLVSEPFAEAAVQPDAPSAVMLTLRWLALVLVASAIVASAARVCADFSVAIGSPLALDYAEGIVWQQALLIFSRRAYGTVTNLPFVAFYYPPVYHVVVRAVALAVPDMLAAGRAVSAVSALLLVPTVSVPVMLAARRSQGDRLPLLCALLAGLLALCMGPAHTWGMLMRVDMLAVLLSCAGLALGAWADGRAIGTTAALLLCVAAVYTKQTVFPAGLALFVVALVRNRRGALIAGGIAAAVAGSALLWLEWATSGGFLLNIIGYNLNRMALAYALHTLAIAAADAPAAFLMVVCCTVISWVGLERGGWRRPLEALRRTDRAGACRAIVVLSFLLTTPTLLTVAKSGGSVNYLINWETSGCVLIGILLSDYCQHQASANRFVAITLFLATSVCVMPGREVTTQGTELRLRAATALVHEIASADRPVLSDDMILLMQAGRDVVAEPFIVSELAANGQWDEGPMIRMIEDHGFSFILTGEDLDDDRRTPAVAAAIRGAYPKVEEVAPGMWAHRP